MDQELKEKLRREVLAVALAVVMLIIVGDRVMGVQITNTIVNTVAVYIVLNSVGEWLPHVLMHINYPLWRFKPLQDDHREEHHGTYAPGHFITVKHGAHVSAPWQLGAVWVVLMAGLGWLVTGNDVVVATAAVTSGLYFEAYNYIHNHLHVPTGGRFEKTAIYAWEKTRHQVHHTLVSPWGWPFNLCVLFPLADWIFGTTPHGWLVRLIRLLNRLFKWWSGQPSKA